MKSPERVKRTVRLPVSLVIRLEECAKESGRSVNAEIVMRLRRSVGDEFHR